MAFRLLNSVRELSPLEITGLVLSAIGYVLMAYYIPRSNFPLLLLIFTILFGIYLFIGIQKKASSQKVVLLLTASIVLRLIFVPATPSLSDDYKRFLWDGHLIQQGINPYEHRPSEIAGEVEGVNSNWKALALAKDHYTAYPPLMQACFFVSAAFENNKLKVIALRFFVLLFELGSIILLFKLLTHFQLSKTGSLIYALNPLVIIELTGNLHFEAAMIFFTLLAVYYARKSKMGLAGLSLGTAILFRLIPLVFIPAFRKKPFHRNQWTLPVAAVALFSAGIMLIGWEGLSNMLVALNYYFTKFEFNGSIYYLIRWIGYQTHGYNIIHLAAPYLSAATLLLALTLVIKHSIKPFNNPFAFMVLFITGYYLLATTVNPWYITPILAFGIFYKRTSAITWTYAVFLSYHAFDGAAFKENPWFLIIEYGLVALAMFYDFVIEPRKNGKTALTR